MGGRIGYLVTPTLLTYFEGGYTQARFGQVNFSYEFLPFGPSGATAYSLPGTTYSGWFLGSGIEYALTWLPIRACSGAASIGLRATRPKTFRSSLPVLGRQRTCTSTHRSTCRRLQPRSSGASTSAAGTELNIAAS